MVYTFFTDTYANTTFFLNGKPVRFKRAMFATEDRELALAVLKKCEEWRCVPGTWWQTDPANPNVQKKKENVKEKSDK